MPDIFISYVEEDVHIVQEIAQGLEAAEYTTWYYTRDSLPGSSYLERVNEMIERAHEGRKHFIPVLYGLTHVVFQQRKPEWRMAVRAAVSIAIPSVGVAAILPRLIEGLRALGIQPPRVPSRSLPLPPPMPLSTAEGKHYACLIGTNEYDADAFPQTPYPEANVDALANQFEDKRIGDFDEVTRLKNKTHMEVIRTIKNLCGQVGENDLLLIYYSGYAILDEEETGQLYLAVKETATDVIPYTSIGVERLQIFLNRCQARQEILILDCHYLNRPEAVSAQIALRQSGTYIISNRPRAVGWSMPTGEETHSLLTKYLIQGLATGAADLNGRGRVTVGEWFTYVQKQMADHGLPQPWKWEAGVEGTWVIARTAESAEASAVVRPASLRRTLKDLTRMFREGLVIPFLGSDATLERALIHKLAEVARELADVPESLHTYPLTVLAQYCQTRMPGGRPQFYIELKRCFPPSITPEPLYRLLAQQEKPLLVVTSAYDTALEQVFQEHNKPYAVVTHIAHAEDWDNLGKVVVQYSDRPDESEICLSDELRIDLERWWVFYKIQGTFDLFIQGRHGREEIDSILISEEDYFEFLGRLSDQHRTMPTLFNRPFQRRLFLFLGYWMSDWNVRTLVHILRQERNLRQVAGYAVRPNAADIEAQFWKRKNVEIVDMEVGNFSSSLAAEMGLRI
jgi:hypothetical protein